MEADPELTKAFQELQMKKSITAQQVDALENKMLSHHRGARINELTLAYVTQQPSESPMYRTLGRAYITTSRSNMEQLLQGKMQKLGENVKLMEENKAVLLKNLKEAENAIRELVLKKKQKMTGSEKA